jgi:hypothetical protein
MIKPCPWSHAPSRPCIAPLAAYLPIAEHGVVGDLHSAALVGTDGTIDWYCPERFDAPAVFGAILDRHRGGFYRVAPAYADAQPKQLYLPDTNVLITRFPSPDGVGEVRSTQQTGSNPTCGLGIRKCAPAQFHFRFFDRGRPAGFLNSTYLSNGGEKASHEGPREAEAPNAAGNPELATLKLAYDQTIQERDRLRGARAFFARQLGPLPTFAGISIGLVGAFSDKIHHGPWLWIALGVLGLLVTVSLLYSGMPAYRQLRASKEIKWRQALMETWSQEASKAKEAGLRVEDVLSPEEWYLAQIRLERELYGEAGKKNRLLPPRWNLDDTDLQDQLDRERTGVFVAQALFLVVIGCLLASSL